MYGREASQATLLVQGNTAPAGSMMESSGALSGAAGCRGCCWWLDRGLDSNPIQSIEAHHVC